MTGTMNWQGACRTGQGLVLLGQFAMSHPDAAWLRALAAYIADATGSLLNILPHGGNSAAPGWPVQCRIEDRR